MTLILKRNIWIIASFFVVIASCLLIGDTRIISYNFGGGDSINVKGKKYDNEIDIFDDSAIHEIEIGLSEEEYTNMVATYKETGEKDYYKTYVTIDGITIPDVGVRLKGNLTLRQALGAGGGNTPRQFNPDHVGKEFPPIANATSARPHNFSTSSKESLPPLLIKIDKFVQGQQYQGLSEIAVRLGSNASLINEPVALYIHKQAGQIVPSSAYAVVKIADQERQLYVICEHLNDDYISKYFPTSSDGILYKAANFVSFSYQGEDPTLYAESFEQKTNINKDDLSHLIKFLKFVSQSSDEEFAEQLSEYLDIDSFVRMMALDVLLGNNDSFSGMGSNYYLYYNKGTEKFHFLSWDLNLAMGGMGGGRAPMGERTESEEERQQIFEKWMAEGGQKEEKKDGPDGRNTKNDLKDRFMANSAFLEKYNMEYEKLKEYIFDESWAIDKVELLADTFARYNNLHGIVDQEQYNEGIKAIKQYLQSKPSQKTFN